jgi:hypothetical protein
MYNRYNNPYNYYNYSPQSNDNFQVVNNLASAEMYPMCPNSKVILMDANLPRIYVKTSDASGISNVESYDLVKVQQEKQSTDYITRQEFEEWKKVLNESYIKQQPAESNGQNNELQTEHQQPSNSF